MKKRFFKKTIAVLAATAMVASLGACSGSSSGTSSDSSAAANSGSEAADSGSAAADSGSEATDSGDSQETIKIAAFFNMSGANADAGLRDKEGTDLAIEDINAAGGIKSLGGRKLEVVYGDTLSDVSQAKAVTERVLADESIVAAVGVGGSAYAAPQLPIIEKNKIPYILFGTAASLTEQGYQYIFRLTPYGGDQGLFGKAQVQFLQYMEENQGIEATKVGIIYENSDYGISLAESNRAEIESARLEVVYEESYPIGLTDASALVANCKSSGAQAVFISSFPQEAKMITNAMKSIDYFPIVVGGGGGFLFPEYATALGDDVEGSVSVASSSFDCQTIQNGDYKDVPARYKEKYGVFMCEHAVTAYNNIIVLADALERAGSTDGDALAQAIRETNIMSMQSGGIIEFDEVGNNKNAVPVIVQWQKQDDGAFEAVTIWPESEATAEYQPIGTNG